MGTVPLFARVFRAIIGAKRLIERGDKMPRIAREASPTGIYHIMARGINRDYIFGTDEEKEKFCEILRETKATADFELYAYVLMDNHLHLLVKENADSIGKIMKRLGVRYVAWYNRRHERIGPLFQDRFKSEVVKDERQFLTVLRYILQNPVKAGMCKKPADYAWGSYRDYISGTGMTETDFALKMLGFDKAKLTKEFARFSQIETGDDCLDYVEKHVRYSDAFLLQQIETELKLGGKGMENCQPEEIEQIIHYLNNQLGVSMRQIARITGQKLGKVFRATR
jgi:REP element-mobilizing transposase RayT